MLISSFLLKDREKKINDCKRRDFVLPNTGWGEGGELFKVGFVSKKKDYTCEKYYFLILMYVN